jgi:uncharacterized protein (TIGR02996 family)
MPTRADFIATILANPSDDTARLVFADWLDENGEPVPAAFVRAQCQRARLESNDPRAKELEREEFRLQWEGHEQIYAKLLLAHLHAMGFRVGGYDFDISVRFNRGLIETVAVYNGEEGAKRLVDNAEDVLSHDPITRLTFVPITVYGAQYSFTPDIEYRATTPISADTLGKLLRVGRVRQIRELDLSGNPLGDEAVRLLTASPQLSELETLRVGSSEHDVGTAYMESFTLLAEISAEGRARLRERFGGRVIFHDEPDTE